MKIKDTPRAIGEIELPTKAEVRRAVKRHWDAVLVVLLAIAAFIILMTVAFQLAPWGERRLSYHELLRSEVRTSELGDDTFS